MSGSHSKTKNPHHKINHLRPNPPNSLEGVCDDDSVRSEAQIAASRANGAKSRGPITEEGKRTSAANSAFSTGPTTPEGKARSSRNAEKHQVLANSVALPAESTAKFLELLEEFRTALLPVGFLEERVVETIAVCDWHRRRYWVLGMAKAAHSAALQEQNCDALSHEMSKEITALPTALAIGDLDNCRTLEFFRRCDSAYSREYRRARAELKELQAERLKREKEDFLARLNDCLETDDFQTVELPDENLQERTEPGTTCDPYVESFLPTEPPIASEDETQEAGAVEKVTNRTEPNEGGPQPYPIRGHS
jgi:hypothetical protein